MSLLLDALKKAADDKKKNLVTDESADKSIDTDESLELDLNLDSGIEETSTGEDFPEVDEPSIPQLPIQQPIDNELSPDFPEEIEAISTDVISEEANASNTVKDNLDTEDLETNNNATADLSAEPDTAPVMPISDMQTKKEARTDKSLSSSNNPVSDENRHYTKTIEKEQALLALINKTNQHSKQARLKQTITIAILVSLLLIGSGVFFYIKMDTANQEIFIAKNNYAPVNRGFEIKKKDVSPVITKTKNTAIETISPKKIAPKKIEKKSKSILIIHTEKQDPVNTLILEAYNQFHSDNYEQANKLYNQVILREPKNRDALLGLSAIAVKQQRYEFARQKYQYLLRLNPKDSIAIAGMSSIKSDTNPQLNESQLKFMLKEKPDSAHLYFALGTLYSSHNKWPEAQSAYFSAWSTENKNADYAYNLAVSLDHLDKRDQALNFYNLSLKLKQASSGNFSAENVSLRIRTLKENNQ
jgi:tetratricopeptide (TPR) repeat protein